MPHAITLRNILGHFKTITHHRHLVLRGCFRVGLYWQGLCHDLSKYSPTEFWTGVRYYQGTRAAPTPPSVRKRAIPRRGCTTRGATATILNTGRT